MASVQVFGDYFKKEAISWSWEFLTEVVGIDPDRLYPSVYEEDDEAFDIWNKDIGIAPERIFRFGKEENFWEHGAGPCGPSSEIYYDRGEKYGCGSPDCTVGCECDRYIEVWNNVFTQFENDGKGNYTELVQKNIDTGMGLERLATVVQDVDSIFDVDTIKALRDKVCELAGVKYHEDDKKDISIRKVTDHIRSVTFMISDGIMPSNEGRGYVLRRLLRRAVRHGHLLGIEGSFAATLANTVIELSKDGYPELEEKKDYILKFIAIEEENFNKTIEQGLSKLDNLVKELEKSGKKELSGEDAFRLYDTFGFPLDLTTEILEEKGITVDEEGFTKAMEQQRIAGKEAREETNYMGADVTIYQSIDANVESKFVGYDKLENNSDITVIVAENELSDTIKEGQKGTILVSETCLYATMGGQLADTGVIVNGDNVFVVEDTIKLQGTKIGHVGYVKAGSFKVGETVTLKADATRRADTCKNHSATHLLQKALRTVLGSHVEQAGSYVDKDRLRFDFTHFSAMSADEIKKVEDLVNEQIAAGLVVDTKEMSLEDAKKSGAMALFGEKYSDKVRVVKMGDFSTELCGGTHVANTSDISVIKILSETGVASGVRRIEAITGKAVFEYYNKLENELHNIAKLLKAEPAMIEKRIMSLQDELKALNSENQKLKNKLAKDAVGDIMDNVTDVNGMKVLATKLSDVDMNELRNLGDQMKEKLGDGIVILASSIGKDKVNLIVTGTDAAVKAGFHAGNVIKQAAAVVGGGGGGRPNMAQAGGKNVAAIDDALTKAVEVVSEQL